MPRTLLLADDSITIQKVVAITFAAENFTVVTVDNGEDAYARARELRPAIIIADVAMPRRNGYELAHAVKSDPELRNIPVLLLAGTFEPLDPAKATASLANGHLVKPFDSQVLIDKVNELLGAAPAVQVPVPVPAPAQAAAAPSAFAPRPAAPQQPMPLGAPRPSMPTPGGVPQRPVPLTQQPMARPPTSPFGIPVAPQHAAPAAMAPPPAAPRPAPTAPPFQAPPRAPLPLTAAFPSAPSAVPVRPQPVTTPLARPTTSPFSSPAVVQPSPVASPPAASPFPSPAAPRPAPSGPAVPVPFARPATSPAGPPRASPFPPAPVPVPAPAPSPTTNLWGTSQPARPTAPMPIAPVPLAAPRAPAPAVAPPPPAAPMPRVPAPAPERRPGAYTPTWGEQGLGSPAAPVAAAPSAPAPQFSSELSVEVSGMAEAAAAASVQPSPGEISLDVAMDEETPELLPEIDGFELGGSQDLDVSLTGGGSPFVSGALSDFAQQGGATSSDGLEFDDGGAANQPLELASPHEFLGGEDQPGDFGADAFPVPAIAAPARAAPSAPPAPASASAVAAQGASDGEAALRQALSQASREVIERVVWEVVPQLAEIILREHVERMEQQRSQG